VRVHNADHETDIPLINNALLKKRADGIGKILPCGWKRRR